MLAEVTRLIGSEDLKLDLLESRWKSCLSFEETRFASIAQIEFIRNLISINPLTPYFEFIRIPETSGSKGASSEHPDFNPHDNLFPRLYILLRGWVQDSYNQSIQFNDYSFTQEMLSRNEGKSL